MKIKVIYADLLDDEVEIRINKNNQRLKDIKQYVENINRSRLVFYKNELKVFVDISEIIFFETEFDWISAHTIDNVYKVRYRLYELEKMLPVYFKRVSKSTIVNKNQIYAINKNITQPGVIIFKNTHKKTYISRMYYKLLKEEFK